MENKTMFFRTKKRFMTAGFSVLASAAAALAVALTFGPGTVPPAVGQNATGPQVATAHLRFEGIASIAAEVADGPWQNAGALQSGSRYDGNCSMPHISR